MKTHRLPGNWRALEHHLKEAKQTIRGEGVFILACHKAKQHQLQTVKTKLLEKLKKEPSANEPQGFHCKSIELLSDGPLSSGIVPGLDIRTIKNKSKQLDLLCSWRCGVLSFNLHVGVNILDTWIDPLSLTDVKVRQNETWIWFRTTSENNPGQTGKKQICHVQTALKISDLCDFCQLMPKFLSKDLAHGVALRVLGWVSATTPPNFNSTSVKLTES